MFVIIFIVVLGGICGVVGKFVVDSLGGLGYYWLFVWEIFCFVYIFVVCFMLILY